MLGLNVLSGLLVIPMLGALWIFLLRGDDEATIETSAPSAENEKAENASTA